MSELPSELAGLAPLDPPGGADLEAQVQALAAAHLDPSQAGLAELAQAATLVAQAKALAEHAAEAPEQAALIASVLSAAERVELRRAGPLVAAAARHFGLASDAALVEANLRAEPVERRPWARKVRGLVAFLIGVAVLPLWAYFGRDRNPTWDVDAGAVAREGPQSEGEQLRDGYSNIRRADYVGARVCGECHVDKHRAWSRHPHSRMNLDAGPDTVQGDFSGVELVYGEVRARFERDGERYQMSLLRGGELWRRYRVTRTVGSRLTQMYIGVQTEGPEPAGDRAYTTEAKLPFGYWTTRRRWLPVNYFDSDFTPDFDEEGSNAHTLDKLSAVHRWEASCIFCHNTYPYEARLGTQSTMTSGFPREDLALPADEGGARRRTLEPGELLALGIECEACHFGGREHVAYEKKPRFLPSAPQLEFPAASAQLVEGARESAYVVNSICAQCHSAKVSLYPDGTGTWNSREAADLAGSACEAVKCTDCHDPHVASPPGGGPDDPRHVEACLRCHEALRPAAAQRAHSRHGEQVSCLDCHMPRRVQGLDAVIRTHRIGSPADERMLSQGGPNACNLCHLDRSIAWTARELSRWGAKVQAQPAWAEHYGGSLERPVGEAWLEHRIPIARLIASDAYARSPLGPQALPRLIDRLDDENAVNRVFALFAIERLLGRELRREEYEPQLRPAKRRARVTALRTSLPAELE